MPDTCATPQDAEDAFYDALEACDLERMLSVWADNDDVCCLLPMLPLVTGREGVEEIFTHMFGKKQCVELSVTHLHWIQTDDIAIHYVEQLIQNPPPGTPPPPPFYGTNIYRNTDAGWRLLVHQNAPAPQPQAELTVPG